MRRGDRGGSLKYPGVDDVFARSRRENDPSDRQIVKSSNRRTGSPRHATRGAENDGALLFALVPRSVTSTPIQSFPPHSGVQERNVPSADVIHTHVCTLTHTYSAHMHDATSRIRASLHTYGLLYKHVQRARVYTLKGGIYIGFPVTTNLPRHRAIYISAESIAPTKNQ